MGLSDSKSKVLIPLIVAFLSLIVIVVTGWFIGQYYSERVYSALEHNSINSDKMLIITKLIETTQFRSRLTGQILVTEDVFERVDMSHALGEYATQFVMFRNKLMALPLSETERIILAKQMDLINKILPRMSLAIELALTDKHEDTETARNILYKEVIPSQVAMISNFMDILNMLRDDVHQSALNSVASHKITSKVNFILLMIFVISMIVISWLTIRRILSVENNLGAANEELVRLNNIKNDFVSLVSHELRTPLTSIKSFTEILFDDVEDMDLETQKKYLGIIKSEGDRLTRLVSNILDLQKIDANKMEWNDEHVNLNDIVQTSIEAFSGAYTKKNIELNIASVDETLTVLADPDKIKQVMSNLLSNALKFTDHGEVLVSVYSFKIKTRFDSYLSTARVCVSDTGPGVPDEEKLKIFESFHQVDNSATRRKGGSGLGLDICRKIINHYEGDIWVESEPERGSSFYFELPLIKTTKKRIGDTLIELGMITDDQLRIALKEQKES